MYESYLRHIAEHGEKETTLERIDFNWHYCKDNCRWATWQEQFNNTRQTKFVVHRGERKSVADWCRHYGFVYSTFTGRLRRFKSFEVVAGMAIDDALLRLRARLVE